jgi:hypothetical protein
LGSVAVVSAITLGILDMLPPVLEIYVVWHPRDQAGKDIAEEFVQHFHGTLFSGLIGGAVEVYIRSEGWRSASDSPRPIPLPDLPPPHGIAQAQLTVIVPILGNEFAAVVEQEHESWREYALKIVDAKSNWPERVGVFPLRLDSGSTKGTKLGLIFKPFQFLAASSPTSGVSEPKQELRCRDLSQAITQLAASDERLTVFISHTKRADQGEEANVLELINRVRSIIGDTRLNDFFDANDLQPGCDWDETLRTKAAKSALLAVRTDLYASREWCQREMLIAKRAGMPVVILDALGRKEERGSFLMDHVPRVPVRHDADQWRDADIRLGLNLLVDECLKRALWRRQMELAQSRPELEIVWWAPHAPEPATFVHWLETEQSAGRLRNYKSLRVLHPDPPLGVDEKAVLEQMVAFGGLAGRLDVMTPRLLAARGG